MAISEYEERRNQVLLKNQQELAVRLKEAGFAGTDPSQRILRQSVAARVLSSTLAGARSTAAAVVTSAEPSSAPEGEPAAPAREPPPRRSAREKKPASGSAATTAPLPERQVHPQVLRSQRRLLWVVSWSCIYVDPV